MQEIILTKGLPGSGKTTWAKQWCAEHPEFKRVNKDDLRLMIDDGAWSGKKEAFILEARDAIVRAALKAGFSVIIDDTNLHSKHKNHMWRIASELDNAIVKIQDFTDVPIAVCIERDNNRDRQVGEKVIRGMYDQYFKDDKQN